MKSNRWLDKLDSRYLPLYCNIYINEYKAIARLCQSNLGAVGPLIITIQIPNTKNIYYCYDGCYLEMALVYKISAVTLLIRNMQRSCKFYSRIPGFKAVYGGAKNDSFTTFEIGSPATKEQRRQLKVRNAVTSCLNLQLLNERSNKKTRLSFEKNMTCSRIIFHADDVDKLYHQLKYDKYIGKLISFENRPTDAPWGERFFHIRDPDDYQLSFAQPISHDTSPEI
jgi:catechol 2,3-dioxygenase-like lactoylglutathione lyase family enzyme